VTDSTALLARTEGFARLERAALGAGIAGLLACGAGFMIDPDQFFESYLIGYLFWSGLALGSLAILMLQHMTGGAWGILIRRILESSTRTLPVLAILFVPVLLGLRRLYLWARPEVVAADELLLHKAPYLNPAFFTIRAAAYFGVWILIAHFLNRWSAEQDRTGDAGLLRRFQLLCGPGLLIYVLIGTFSSVDWVMSLEPHWFSTIYGVLFVAGQVLGAISFAIAVVVALSRREPMASYVAASHYHDLGKLLLAFVLVWSYFAFSQFLIIWAGNLPEEIPWYLRRFSGGWQWVGLALVILQFALPFVMLLSRSLKRDSALLGRVAILVILARLVDVYWMTAPALRESLGGFHWLDIAAAGGIGGIWLFFFLRKLRERPLMPLGDPFAREMMRHADG